MSERIKIAFVSFGRGMATFIRPWRYDRRPSETHMPSRGIGVYFGRVGKRLDAASERYAEMHPELVVSR